MPRQFTNIDSLWLEMLRTKINSGEIMVAGNEHANEIMGRLAVIAENLQSLDERNMALMTASGGYAQGVADAEARMRRRSNILTNPKGEDERGKTILDQINRRVAEGNLKKIAMGERALDDAPDKFNGRKRAAAKPQAVPAIDLDLSFLGEL